MQSGQTPLATLGATPMQSGQTQVATIGATPMQSGQTQSELEASLMQSGQTSVAALGATPMQSEQTLRASSSAGPSALAVPAAGISVSALRLLESELNHKVVLVDASYAEVVHRLEEAMKDRATASAISAFIKRYGTGALVPRSLRQRAERAADIASRL
eukprot:3733094-Amphidinium_carterae.1